MSYVIAVFIGILMGYGTGSVSVGIASFLGISLICFGIDGCLRGLQTILNAINKQNK